MNNIFRDEIFIEGKRFYVKDDGQDTLVDADKYDALFKPKSTGKPNWKTKGPNPDRRNAWVNNQKSY